jgi:hypothetical protein
MKTLDSILLVVNPLFYYANIYQTDLSWQVKAMVGLWMFNQFMRNLSNVLELDK